MSASDMQLGLDALYQQAVLLEGLAEKEVNRKAEWAAKLHVRSITQPYIAHQNLMLEWGVICPISSERTFAKRTHGSQRACIGGVSTTTASVLKPRNGQNCSAKLACQPL